MIIYHHLGLGDHFICNGIVNYICCQSPEKNYTLVCKSKYLETISSLYQYNLPKLKLLPVIDEYLDVINYLKLHPQEILRIGFENLSSVVNFDEQFYNQVKLNFNIRYVNAFIPEHTDRSHELYLNLTSQLENKKYAIVHDHCSHGKLNIDTGSINLPIIYVSEITNNLLDWIELIQKADEIHVVPSSFYCMIDSLSHQRITSKLFYHKNRTNTFLKINRPENNHKWSIINYE